MTLLHITTDYTGGDAFWQILLMLTGAFILGYLVRFFIGRKYKTQVADLESDKAKCYNRVADLEAQLKAKSAPVAAAPKVDTSALEKANADLKLRIAELEAKLSAAPPISPATSMSAALPLVSAADVKPDDLKKVEGIGPKIEKLLNADGIYTWKQLSQADPAHIKEVLLAAGPRYRIHDPSTWPHQAELCDQGKWAELEKLQDELKGGREV